MYRFGIFISVMLFSFLQSHFVLASPKLASSISMKQTIRDQFKSTQNAILKEKELAKKIVFIKKLATQINSEMVKQKKVTPDLGIWLDTVKGGLAIFPHDQTFDLKKCPYYRQQLKVQYDPSEPVPTFEPVKLVDELLKEVCR